MALLPNYYAWIAAHFVDHLSGSVLELGCGAGFVMKNYVDRVTNVVAVDINPAAERLERSYPAGKVKAACVDLRGDWNEIVNVRADCVIALDVVEHFQRRRGIHQQARTPSETRGKVVIKVPAQSKLYNAMDEASGHFRRYDDDTLRALMETRGFETLSRAI